MVAMSKSIRSRNKPSLFIVSCCTVLIIYLALSTWLHVTLSINESENVIKRADAEVGESNKVIRSKSSKSIEVENVYGYENAEKNPIGEPWSHPIIHIVTSRFMQGQADLKHLTQARLELFQAICLPSITGQELMDDYLSQLSQQNDQADQKTNGAIDPPFIWIIKVDPGIDTSILSTMIQLLEPFPNFFLVGIGIDDTVGKWKEEQTKNKLLQGNVYTGDKKILHRAHHFRNENISLETRLDADDGLHRSYLKTVEEQAMKSLRYQPQNNAINENKANWRAWCAWRSLEWFPEPPNIKSNEKTNEIGSILPSVNDYMCLSAGLTIGISVGVKTSEVPSIQHQQLLNAALSRKLKCGLKEVRKCVKLVTKPDFSAFRARTITSAGMKGIQVDSDSSRRSSSSVKIIQEEVQTILDNFHLKLNELHHANQYFTNADNIVDIASENLRGQCTKGHSCKKSSREKLQAIIDLGGRLWD